MSAERIALAVILAGLLAGAARAQVGSDAKPEKAWAFSAAAYAFFPPDESAYVSPVFRADGGRLHLEARYNYEGQKAGSIWAGYNLGGGKKVTVDATLMGGVVFGDTRGVAPGCEITVAHKGLEFYTEGEWLIDADDSANNFLYFWSELTYAPVDWFRAGLASQRTRAYETELDVQRGIVVGFSFKDVSLSAYVFNLGWTDPTYVVSLGGEF